MGFLLAYLFIGTAVGLFCSFSWFAAALGLFAGLALFGLYREEENSLGGVTCLVCMAFCVWLTFKINPAIIPMPGSTGMHPSIALGGASDPVTMVYVGGTGLFHKLCRLIWGLAAVARLGNLAIGAVAGWLVWWGVVKRLYFRWKKARATE